MPTIRQIKQKAWAAAVEAYAAASDGRSLIADFADGFGVRFRLLKGTSVFTTRLVESGAKYLLDSLLFAMTKVLPALGVRQRPVLDLAWLEGQEVPVSVYIDPTVDTYPTEAAPFIGGPYDGRVFTVEDGKTDVTLVGGHRYVWDGKVFNYQKDK